MPATARADSSQSQELISDLPKWEAETQQLKPSPSAYKDLNFQEAGT